MNCREKYKYITEKLITLDMTVSAMESCTSGLISSLITDTEGSSAVMKGAFVTYSNEAKIKCGVPEEIIETYGVYSRETAEAMAAACMDAFGSRLGIGVTGSFANVDPANADSVPGQVYFTIRCKKESGICVKSFLIEDLSDPERYKAKFMAADRIADELMAILEE